MARRPWLRENMLPRPIAPPEFEPSRIPSLSSDKADLEHHWNAASSSLQRDVVLTVRPTEPTTPACFEANSVLISARSKGLRHLLQEQPLPPIGAAAADPPPNRAPHANAAISGQPLIDMPPPYVQWRVEVPSDGIRPFGLVVVLAAIHGLSACIDLDMPADELCTVLEASHILGVDKAVFGPYAARWVGNVVTAIEAREDNVGAAAAAAAERKDHPKYAVMLQQALYVAVEFGHADLFRTTTHLLFMRSYLAGGVMYDTDGAPYPGNYPGAFQTVMRLVRSATNEYVGGTFGRLGGIWREISRSRVCAYHGGDVGRDKSSLPPPVMAWCIRGASAQFAGSALDAGLGCLLETEVPDLEGWDGTPQELYDSAAAITVLPYDERDRSEDPACFMNVIDIKLRDAYRTDHALENLELAGGITDQVAGRAAVTRIHPTF